MPAPWLAEAFAGCLGFARRHRWSLPLAILASATFVHFASEVREGELAAFDRAVFEAVGPLHGHLDGLMLWLTRLGGTIGMVSLTVAGVLVLSLLRHFREALFLAVGAGGALLLNTLLKLVFHRSRPDTYRYLIDTPTSFSFPSGHAMGSMGVLASLIIVLYVLAAPRWVRVPALLLAALSAFGVALSRVYFGVHYPSDVIAGELAALAWVSAVTGQFHPGLLRGERRKAPPRPAPDGRG
jgi:membrane-associated phospholipid phosphatase